MREVTCNKCKLISENPEIGLVGKEERGFLLL